jgi:hypothetical protein
VSGKPSAGLISVLVKCGKKLCEKKQTRGSKKLERKRKKQFVVSILVDVVLYAVMYL